MKSVLIVLLVFVLLFVLTSAILWFLGIITLVRFEVNLLPRFRPAKGFSHAKWMRAVAKFERSARRGTELILEVDQSGRAVQLKKGDQGTIFTFFVDPSDLDRARSLLRTYDLVAYDDTTDREFVPAGVVAVSAKLPLQFDLTTLIRESVTTILRAERPLTICYIR